MISGYFIGSAVEVPAADVSPPIVAYPRLAFTPVPTPWPTISVAPVIVRPEVVDTWPRPTVNIPRQPSIDQDARSIVKPTPRVVPPARGVTQVGSSHSVKGQASWYCSSTSACHHSYPGGLYAAAGPALRVGNWRGRAVSVCGNGNCVTVKLIDFCACSSTRVIDLYSDAFKRLAPLSSGVLRVKVSW